MLNNYLQTDNAKGCAETRRSSAAVSEPPVCCPVSKSKYTTDPCEMYKQVRPIWRYEMPDGHDYVVYSNGTCKGFPKDGVLKVNAIYIETERRIQQAMKFNALVVPLSFRLHRMFQRLKDLVFRTRPTEYPEIQSESIP